MTQLSDDCFAFGGPLLSVEAAAELIAERIAPIDAFARVPLAAANGRLLAETILATHPLPPFRNAAVDGYAFAHDAAAPATGRELRLIGRIAAGDTGVIAVEPGTAIRIFTGAPMPPGADTVLMQEDAREADGHVLAPAGLPRCANVREAGEDLAAGRPALAAGRRLGPAEIGLLAALGRATVPVRPALRVAVFSTGDELASPGAALGPAQVFDSNRAMLLALLARLPVVATDLGILRDDPAVIATALAAAAATHDLLITSGGVSTGEADHVRTAIQARGRLVFWRLAVKPGRPAAMGVIGGTPIVGLPGNPVAALVTFLHLARPLILRRAGGQPERLSRFAARCDFTYRKKLGRREYVRVRLRYDEDDPVPRAEKFAREGAGLLTSLTESDALAELPEASEACVPGQLLTILPFAAVL